MHGPSPDDPHPMAGFPHPAAFSYAAPHNPSKLNGDQDNVLPPGSTRTT